MKCNVGPVERNVRVLVGLPLVALGYYYRHLEASWTPVVFWGGVLLILTAALAWCPIHFLKKSLRRS